MKKLTKVLKALSDPNRLRIIKLLQLKTMCVCELQFSMELAQSSISKHLKILEEADLVSARKDGLWVNYSICESPENPYAADMLEKLDAWLKQNPAFDDIVKKAELADRLIITRA
ncbi:MAG: metalloregulator ArsR/SmtB family transcription factor [Desulfobacteraceae bacterium]|nr:metalloregulator ArsR/SmtB family transcription factor [Desulfobacteraceae bacterium]